MMRAIGWAVLAVGLVACGGESELASTESCAVSADCALGSHCSGGLCVPVDGTALTTCELDGTCVHEWRTGDFGVCSTSCGVGVRTREIWCERSDGVRVDAGLCRGDAPDAHEACLEEDDCGPHYGDWSPWSECVEGRERRTRQCSSPKGVVQDCAACGGACVAERSCEPCSRWSQSVVSCFPDAPGDEASCSATVGAAREACLEMGCTWSGASACSIAGNPASSACFGATGTCS